jgi:hypothetical protein
MKGRREGTARPREGGGGRLQKTGLTGVDWEGVFSQSKNDGAVRISV